MDDDPENCKLTHRSQTGQLVAADVFPGLQIVDSPLEFAYLLDGVIREEFDTEPMTTTVERAEADALVIISDSSQM